MGKSSGHGDYERTSSIHPAPGNARGSIQREEHKREQVKSEQTRGDGKSGASNRRGSGVRRQREGMSRERGED